METEQDGNTGIWYRKSNWKDFFLNFDPDVIPENCTRVKPLENVECQRFDDEAGEWVPDPEAERQARIEAVKAGLAAIDREAGAGRAVRGLALAAAAAAGIAGGKDYARLQEYENRAAPLREQVRQLEEEPVAAAALNAWPQR